MSSRNKVKKQPSSTAKTVEELQAENDKLREMLAEAMGTGSVSNLPPNLIVFKPTSREATAESKGPSRGQSREGTRGRSSSKGGSRGNSREGRSGDSWNEPSSLPNRPKEKIRYYAENLRPKTPQEKAEEKQEHLVREAQWQGRQEGGYKPTAIVEKPTLTIRQAYESKDSVLGEGEGELGEVEPSSAPEKKSGTPKESSLFPNNKPNPNRVEPLAGKNVQVVDRSEVPQLQHLPTEYNVKGLEVDSSKLPLPLTENEVEVRTAMVTGIRPHLPGALEFEEELRKQREELQAEAKDNQQHGGPGKDRPVSRGPAVDYTQNMLQNMELERDYVSSRGDSTAAYKADIRERISNDLQLSRPGSSQPSERFLPEIHQHHHQQQQHQQQHHHHAVNLDVFSRPPDDAGVASAVGIVSGDSMWAPGSMGGTPSMWPSDTTVAVATTTQDALAAADDDVSIHNAMKIDNAVNVNVPMNAKGVFQEMIPIHSEFITGILNRRRPDDPTALHVRDAPPKHWVAPQHPLLVNLLASAKPLWKTASTQVYDPNLYLTLFPPPPETIIISIMDIVAVYNGLGTMHLGNNVVNNATATVTINIREYTVLLYELINKYNDEYVPVGGSLPLHVNDNESNKQALHPGSVIPHVSRVFEPSSLEWWRRYAKFVLVVRSKPSGTLYAKISKKLIDRLVQTLLINNSFPNMKMEQPYDGVHGSGAGVNVYDHLNGEHQDHSSIRINEHCDIHSWDFSHVRPVDHLTTIHQIGWTNIYGRNASRTSTTAAGSPTTTRAGTGTNTAATAATAAAPAAAPAAATAAAATADADADANAGNRRELEEQFNKEVSNVDMRDIGLDPNNNHNVIALPANAVPEQGITFEDVADANVTSSQTSITDDSNKKKKKKKKKKVAPVNGIPDELLERNARFEVGHMMVFNVVTTSDENVVGSNVRPTVREPPSINSSATKEQLHSKNKAKQVMDTPTSLTKPSKSNEGVTKFEESQSHIPAGTPSPERVNHAKVHKIHTYSGSHLDGSDGVIVVHAHHDKSVAERMNSPNARYKVMPNRSCSPGFFGNENQKGNEEKFVGGYWNDNTDVSYPGSKPAPNLRATSNHNNERPKIKPRPELFLDEDKIQSRKKKLKEKEEEKRAHSPGSKIKREYLTADEVARKTIIRAREVVSTNTKFRTRKLTDVEAGLFRSPFAVPLVTEAMREAVEALED